MKSLIMIAFILATGCTSIPQRAVASQPPSTDYLVKNQIQGAVASHPAVQSFISALKYTNCSLPKEIAGAFQMCTMMTQNNRCNFAFTFDCDTAAEGLAEKERVTVSGAAQYTEKTQSLKVFELLLPWPDGSDWIQHLSR